MKLWHVWNVLDKSVCNRSPDVSQCRLIFFLCACFLFILCTHFSVSYIHLLMLQELLSHDDYIWNWSSPCNILCSQLFSCESSPPGGTEGLPLMTFKAEVPVSFRKHTFSDFYWPRRARVQVDHFCSLLSPPRPRLSAPWLAFTVMLNSVIPAVKAFAAKVHAFFSLLKPAIHPRWVHFLVVTGVQVRSVYITGCNKWRQKAKKNKNKAAEWKTLSQADVCCTYWCAFLTKRRNRLALFWQ